MGGEYHGFFSEFGGTCGMNEWDNHSKIVHAVAKDANPKGGYVRTEVAIPAFSHCIDPVRISAGPHNGTWLLFHNGDGQPRACGEGTPDCDQKPIEWVAQCNGGKGDGTTPGDDKISARPAPKLPKGFEPSNGVHQSQSPGGPWVKPSEAALEGLPFCDCPAVHALSNGSIIMWCQPLVNYFPGDGDAVIPPIFINEGWGTPFAEKPATLTIPKWLVAASLASSTPDWNQWIKLDDPTLWTDEDGHFHVLAHNGDGPFPCGDGPQNLAAHYGLRYRDGNPYPVGCTAHLYSENGLDWVMSPVAASNASILLASGVSIDLFRQRPKVLLSPAGKGSAITHLFHGSMQCGERPITGGGYPNNQCTNTSWPGPAPAPTPACSKAAFPKDFSGWQMFGLQQAPAADVARCVAAACGVGADVFQWSDADGCWVGDYGADGVANPDVTSGARPSVPPPPAPKPPTTPATAPVRGNLGITAPTDMDYSFTTVVPLNTQS
jgi:hypothetical protein